MQLNREFKRIERCLSERTTRLEDCWRCASVADRFLASQRLVQSHRLRTGHAKTLEELNLTVQRIWTDLRRHRKYARDAHDNLRIFSLEEELKRAERSRDGYLDAENLVEELFSVAETFFANQLDPNEESFRDLCRRRDAVQERLAARRAGASSGAAKAVSAFTTQTMAIVYSLTGEQPVHSSIRSAVA